MPNERLDDLLNEILWADYLEYLRQWSESHRDPKFFGNSPASFNEWMWNDRIEEGESND